MPCGPCAKSSKYCASLTFSASIVEAPVRPAGRCGAAGARGARSRSATSSLGSRLNDDAAACSALQVAELAAEVDAALAVPARRAASGRSSARCSSSRAPPAARRCAWCCRGSGTGSRSCAGCRAGTRCTAGSSIGTPLNSTARCAPCRCARACRASMLRGADLPVRLLVGAGGVATRRSQLHHAVAASAAICCAAPRAGRSGSSNCAPSKLAPPRLRIAAGRRARAAPGPRSAPCRAP